MVPEPFLRAMVEEGSPRQQGQGRPELHVCSTYGEACALASSATCAVGLFSCEGQLVSKSAKTLPAGHVPLTAEQLSVCPACRRERCC